MRIIGLRLILILLGKVNGQIYGEESSMKNAIVHFYENLLHDDHPQRPLLDGIFYDTISMEDACGLEKDF